MILVNLGLRPEPISRESDAYATEPPKCSNYLVFKHDKTRPTSPDDCENPSDRYIKFLICVSPSSLISFPTSHFIPSFFFLNGRRNPIKDPSPGKYCLEPWRQRSAPVGGKWDCQEGIFLQKDISRLYVTLQFTQ